MNGAAITDRPLACAPWLSYRYAGDYGWIMIGAMDDAEALREAARSLSHGVPVMEKLQRWNGSRYVAI